MKLGSNAFAKKIGKTPGRVRQMISDGEIDAEKIGRDWIIDESQIKKAKSLPHRRDRQKNKDKAA